MREASIRALARAEGLAKPALPALEQRLNTDIVANRLAALEAIEIIESGRYPCDDL